VQGKKLMKNRRDPVRNQKASWLIIFQKKLGGESSNKDGGKLNGWKEK